MIGTMAAVAAAATLYVAPAGRDAHNACTDPAKPCRTVAAATNAARPGQTVRLAGGSYGDTAISRDGVRVVPAPGATVRLGDLRVSASRVELQALQAQTLRVGADAHDQTYKDMTLRRFEIFSDGDRAPRNISILGGSIGPSVDGNNIIGSNGPATTASPTNIVLDGVLVHDFTLAPGSDAQRRLPAGVGGRGADHPRQHLPQLRGVRHLPAEAARRPGRHAERDPDREQLPRLLPQRLLLDPDGRPSGHQLAQRHDPQQLHEQGDQS